MNIWITPFISAFIGWFTTWIAFKFLFYPKQPINILGYKLQGIFPKERMRFAEKLGEVVDKELLSVQDIKAKLMRPELADKIMPHIEAKMDAFLQTKLAEHLPLVSMFIGKDTLANIKQGISTEIRNSIPVMIEKLGTEMEAELDIKKMVSEKINNFSQDKFEEILNAIMKKEFVFVEIVCGIFGFIIGIIQVLIARI